MASLRRARIPLLAVLERPTRKAVIDSVRAGATSVLAGPGSPEAIRARLAQMMS